MRKLITVAASVTVNVDANTDQEARDMAENDPLVKAMIQDRLAREGYEVTDIQNADN